MILLAALLGLVLHEAAHAWVADQLGDPVPGLYGRVTLNPLAHLDPVWSGAVPLLLVLAGLPPIGKGRTVELSAAGDQLLVYLAGPLANIVLATALFYIWPIGAHANMALAAFNLLPVPGMDGGRILSHLWRKS